MWKVFSCLLYTSVMSNLTSMTRLWFSSKIKQTNKHFCSKIPLVNNMETRRAVGIPIYFTNLILFLSSQLSLLVAAVLPCLPFAPVPEYTHYNRIFLKGSTHRSGEIHSDYIQSVSNQGYICTVLATIKK